MKGARRLLLTRSYLHLGNLLGLERVWGLTLTRFGPGFAFVRTGRHLVLVAISHHLLSEAGCLVLKRASLKEGSLKVGGERHFFLPWKKVI